MKYLFVALIILGMIVFGILMCRKYRDKVEPMIDIAKQAYTDVKDKIRGS